MPIYSAHLKPHGCFEAESWEKLVTQIVNHYEDREAMSLPEITCLMCGDRELTPSFLKLFKAELFQEFTPTYKSDAMTEAKREFEF